MMIPPAVVIGSLLVVGCRGNQITRRDNTDYFWFKKYIGLGMMELSG